VPSFSSHRHDAEDDVQSFLITTPATSAKASGRASYCHDPEAEVQSVLLTKILETTSRASSSRLQRHQHNEARTARLDPQNDVQSVLFTTPATSASASRQLSCPHPHPSSAINRKVRVPSSPLLRHQHHPQTLFVRPSHPTVTVLKPTLRPSSSPLSQHQQ
jgi:hypothetical protein